jgi:hypothetical protein
MPDAEQMAIVSRVIAEHQTIHHNIKLMGESMNDMEAILHLEQRQQEWKSGMPEAVAAKQKKLAQTLITLEQGLKNHFSFEEKYLFPLTGELLAESLTLDHKRITRELEGASTLVREMHLGDVAPEESAAQEDKIRKMIHSLHHLVEKHATTESAIIESMNRALQKRQRAW